MKQILLLIILVMPLFASAGFRRGNGGVMLVCEGGDEKHYQLLDMFEAEGRYLFRLKFEKEGDEFQRAQKIVDRLGKINPNRKKLYSEWLRTFANEIMFVKGLNIVEVPDVGVAYIPDNCTLKQMIVQAEPMTKFENRYTIDERLWDLLDFDQRAAAIVHELIYREAISFENQHNSSEPTRLLNSFIHSDLMEPVNLKAWLELVQGLGFHRADAHGFSVKLNAFSNSSFSRQEKADIEFYDDNHLKSAGVPYTANFQVLGGDYAFKCESNVVAHQNSSKMSFYKNGAIRRIALSGTYDFETRCPDLLLSSGGESHPMSFSPTVQGPIYALSYKDNGDLNYVVGRSGAKSTSRSSSLEMNRLAIETEHFLIDRSFAQIPEWNFILKFEKNRPVYLRNEQFDSTRSKSCSKTEDGCVSFPHHKIQDLN